jgi:hypothetical protein
VGTRCRWSRGVTRTGRMYTEAGKPGWATIIPFYAIVVWCQIAGKPDWWLILVGMFVIAFGRAEYQPKPKT